MTLQVQNPRPLVLGIDPAPAKPAAIWSRTGLTKLRPAELRSFLEGQVRGLRSVIVVWDSPLSFDPGVGFSDRSIDRAARAWVSAKVSEGLIEAKAVSVVPFSGCPHWVLSCHVLGLPFGQEIEGLSLHAATESEEMPAPGRSFVVEVHPAVALAALWIDRRIDAPFPRYKGSAARDVPAVVASQLGFPEQAGEDDDALDAFIAYRLGTQVISGEARVVGDPAAGGYLLPAGGCATEIGGPRRG